MLRADLAEFADSEHAVRRTPLDPRRSRVRGVRGTTGNPGAGRFAAGTGFCANTGAAGSAGCVSARFGVGMSARESGWVGGCGSFTAAGCPARDGVPAGGSKSGVTPESGDEARFGSGSTRGTGSGSTACRRRKPINSSKLRPACWPPTGEAGWAASTGRAVAGVSPEVADSIGLLCC